MRKWVFLLYNLQIFVAKEKVISRLKLFFLSKNWQKTTFTKCVPLRLITASILLGMSLNMACNCFFGILAYILIIFLLPFHLFSPKCFSAKFWRVFVQCSNRLELIFYVLFNKKVLIFMLHKQLSQDEQQSRTHFHFIALSLNASFSVMANLSL